MLATDFRVRWPKCGTSWDIGDLADPQPVQGRRQVGNGDGQAPHDDAPRLDERAVCADHKGSARQQPGRRGKQGPPRQERLQGAGRLRRHCPQPLAKRHERARPRAVQRLLRLRAGDR